MTVDRKRNNEMKEKKLAKTVNNINEKKLIFFFSVCIRILVLMDCCRFDSLHKSAHKMQLTHRDRKRHTHTYNTNQPEIY